MRAAFAPKQTKGKTLNTTQTTKDLIIIRSANKELCRSNVWDNLSLRLGKVQQFWKTSRVVLAPTTAQLKDLNSYRPVSLIYHLMKTLERLVHAHLWRLVSG